MRRRWPIHELGSLVEISSGGTPSMANSDFWGGSVPWISAKDLKRRELTDSLVRLTEAGANDAGIVPKGTILILVRGMTLFRRVPVALAGCDLAFNQDLKGLQAKDGLNPEYLFWALSAQEPYLLRKVDSAGHGTGRLNTELLLACPISLPPLPVQRRIAEILRTWDDAIETTNRLIAAKNLEAQSFAQKAFEGVVGERNVRSGERLNRLFLERDERATSDEELLAITGDRGIIRRDLLVKRDTSNADKSKYKLICPGDIGYNTMRMWQGVSGLSKLKGIVSPAYTIVTPLRDKVFGEYAAHLFKWPRMINEFHRYSQGLVDDTLNLKFHHFSEIKICLPSLARQKVVANALSQLGAERRLLEGIADALSKQKRGLMQKLMTGEWPVSVPKSKEAAE